MHYFNQCVKTMAQCLAILNFLFGLGLLGYGLYVVFLPWGGVNRENYVAMGIVVTLFGAAWACVSLFGCNAADHQLTRYGRGWTGRSEIAVYALYLACLFVAIVFGYMEAAKILADTSDSIDLLKADPTAHAPYTTIEKSIREHFNTIFFHVNVDCDDAFDWFWSFVREHCPEGLHKDSCQRCEDYFVTICSAYEPLCYSDDGTVEAGNNFACPYNNCRLDTLQFFYDTSYRTALGVLIVVGLITLLQLVLNLLLICHRQTKKHAVTVVDAGTEEDDHELLQAQEDLLRQQQHQQHLSQIPGGGVGGSSSDHMSTKSVELNYQTYSYNEHIEMERTGTVAAPPNAGGGASGKAKYTAVSSSSRQETESIQMTTMEYSSQREHAPLAGTKHKPTAYSTYQMQMEIALAESNEAAAAAGSKASGVGKSSVATGLVTRSEADLALALEESKKEEEQRTNSRNGK